MTTKYDPQAADTALNHLDQVKARRSNLHDELKSLNDRVAAVKAKGETPDAGSLERMKNIMRGLDKLGTEIEAAEKAWSDQLLAGYSDGKISGETGDGANPTPIVKVRGNSLVPGSPITSSIVEQMLKAKWDPKTNPSVLIDGHEAFTKTQTLPTFSDWQRREPIVTPLGADARFMWQAMVTEGLDPKDTSIQDFRMTAATVSGTVERAPSAVTTKADLDTTTTLVNTAVRQFAITISDIPNQLLTSVGQLANFMAQRAEFELEKALDSHVYSTIVAATPPFGNAGGSTLMAQIRRGITTMRATGATPRVLVLNPTDSESLDQTTTADGIHILTNPVNGGSGDTPVWSLRRVERIGAGTEPPYIIDPQMLGVLYIGGMQIDSDPYSGFKNNTTTLRMEFNALMHIRNINGARRIAAT
jgi:hypothetical protein